MPHAKPIRVCLFVMLALLGLLSFAPHARAAGTLAPASSSDAPMRILDHHVEVRIENGFARTEVTQQFENPNDHVTEAIYSLPLPLGAALSEMTVETADRTLYGEVVAASEAEELYEEQRDAGRQAGLATKQGYQRFEFRIAALPAGEQVTLTFAYYQALTLEDGVGRYLYPLEEGGTDPEAESFWTQNDVVDGSFRADITLRSVWPVEDVRIPDFGNAATITQDEPGTVHATVDTQADLGRDLVFYYRLPNDLPGRVEVVTHRDDPEGPGTFMMVLTPGLDLAPLSSGRDHVFVIDVSGSMRDKLATVKEAVARAMDTLEPGDRYRIFKFSDEASEVTSGWVDANGGMNEESMQDLGIDDHVASLQVEGGTNLFAGLDLALSETDPDRASAVYLLTDAVANQGVIDPQRFAALTAERDIRIYGMLMGNSGNWPLMKLITDTSGGFYAQVSNQDDVMGQIMLARDKTTHEAIHDFEVTIDGGDTHALTHNAHKVHRGEQVVIFGRYAQAGTADFTIDATVTGKQQRFTGRFELPASDTLHPELERLWAFEQVRWLEYQSRVGLIDADEAAAEIAQLGVDYQLVTDETSMILLREEAFAELGIDPDNRERNRREDEARDMRAMGEPADHSVPVDDAFTGAAPSGGGSAHGSGGGAMGADDAVLMGLLGLGLVAARRRRRTRGA